MYAKLEKCEFGVKEVDCLGHKITQEGLKMDDHKVKAILDWESPKLVLALRSFLGLASYYRKFIKSFAKIAAPLTNLLKRSFGTYEWDSDAPPTPQRTQMWAQVAAKEEGVGARSLAHNPLRGRGAGWSSGMGLRRIDKLHSLTRACTKPSQSG